MNVVECHEMFLKYVKITLKNSNAMGLMSMMLIRSQSRKLKFTMEVNSKEGMTTFKYTKK